MLVFILFYFLNFRQIGAAWFHTYINILVFVIFIYLYFIKALNTYYIIYLRINTK